MMSNSQIMAQELQLQMGDRLPGAIQAMARAALKAGIITEKAGEPLTRTMKDAMARGELIAEHILPYFAKELWELANQGGALEEAMNNTSAAFGRFRTNVMLANNTVNESGYDIAVRNMMNRASDAIMRSESAWEALGKTLFFLGQGVEAPIELFGAISEKMPILSNYVRENALAFKALAAYLLLTVTWMRRLFILVAVIPAGIKAISDLLLDFNRDRTFAEWALQIGLATAAVFMLISALGKLLTGMKRVKDFFKPKTTGGAGTTTRSPTGGPSSGPGGFIRKLGSRVFGPAYLMLHSEKLGGGLDYIDGHDNRSGFNDARLLNDSTLDEWLKSTERKIFDQLDDSNLEDWLKSTERKIYEQLNDSNIEEYLRQGSSTNHINAPTTNSIGQVTINVNSTDPSQAAEEIRVQFMQMFENELHINSVSEMVTEK